MALLLIIPSWLLLLSLVTGLCHAARLGDRQLQQGSPTHAASASSADSVAAPNGVLSPGSCDRTWGLLAVCTAAEQDADLSARSYRMSATRRSG